MFLVLPDTLRYSTISFFTKIVNLKKIPNIEHKRDFTSLEAICFKVAEHVSIVIIIIPFVLNKETVTNYTKLREPVQPRLSRLMVIYSRAE